MTTEIQVPAAKPTRLNSPTETREWAAFSDYFERRNGYQPQFGDDTVRELYCYYIVGTWDKEAGRV
jgi:hypothetical protein